MPLPFQVFTRVSVDFLVLGNARIHWEISPHFHQPLPWNFQLQVAETDLPSGNWVNVGAPVTSTFFIMDPTRRAFGKDLNVFYRLVLTTGNATTYISQAATVLGDLDLKSWNIATEILRKENLRLSRLKVGIEGLLLKAKESGIKCPVCIDQFDNEVTDSKCPICFGQYWEGGYYNPFPAIFADINQPQRNFVRDLESGQGMTNPQITKGMFLALPFLTTRDVWVNKTTDLRYQVHEIDVRTHIRGVPILTSVGLRPIPFDDVIYTIPVS